MSAGSNLMYFVSCYLQYCTSINIVKHNIITAKPNINTEYSNITSH